MVPLIANITANHVRAISYQVVFLVSPVRHLLRGFVTERLLAANAKFLVGRRLSAFLLTFPNR